MPQKPSKSPAGKGPRTAARRPARVAAKRPKAASKATAKAASKATPDLSQERVVRALETIAAHLSAQGKLAVERESFKQADAFVWHPDGRLAAVPRVSRVELFLLKGVDRVRDILIENTERFTNGLPANNALLWGARGMGKSSLVKAAHASINAERKPADRLKLIEIHREDIESLPALMEQLRASSFRFIVFLRRPLLRRQ
ncbi:putative AAA+ superfamily ATPase [Bradyrhizobium sp. LM3.2]